MARVKVASYCPGQSNNYGLNALVVTLGNIDFYFSYQTLVAFDYPGRLVVHKNDWGPTTGKHLNAIDGGGKSSRVTHGVFEAELNGLLDSLALEVPDVRV